MNRISLVFASLCLALISGVGFANEIECTVAIEKNLKALENLQAAIGDDLINDSHEKELIKWKAGFRADVESYGWTEHIEGAVIGGATSVVGSLLVGASISAPATGVAIILSSSYLELKELWNTIGQWPQIDANTAMMTWLLDYIEYGRVGSVEDDHLKAFLEHTKPVLIKLTGNAPPANSQALIGYLSAHAPKLLTFFGNMEEAFGADSFPRWKFPEVQGRFPGNRWSVGYYRGPVRDYLKSELAQAAREIKILGSISCKGKTPPPIPTCPVGGLGSAGEKTCLCDIKKLGKVWGSGIFTADSSICTAAVHEGLIHPQADAQGNIYWKGIITIKSQKGCPYYKKKSRYGVNSKSYGEWRRSFYFPVTSSGYCDSTSIPAPNIWYCPRNINNLKDHTCHCSPKSIEAGNIWGTTYYTDDSEICKAARHYGAVSANGGTVRVMKVGGLDEYEGSVSNGVRSRSYGTWRGSIIFP